MICAFRPWSVPRAFPVAHRPSPATRRLVEVASEADRVLLCDDAHAGDHMWPTGEMVTGAAGEAAGIDGTTTTGPDGDMPGR
ncbi:MAG: hypothetical protein H0U40_00080 [Chloroflexia bacterium]|nr:hypothetical protein [Chloroflexia bacterium]MDQ3512944.1 hypothetical protein [Chloroflexota bacterium]